MLHPLLPVSPGVQHIYLISTFLVSMISAHVLNHKKFSVDCTWSNWSSWGSCSKTCGSGTKTRSRSKNGPYHDGIDCVGSSSDSTSCNTNSCPASKPKSRERSSNTSIQLLHSLGAAVTKTISSFLLDQVYIKVTDGTCNRITSKAECEEAARQLGLSDNVASLTSLSGKPRGCYTLSTRSNG